MKKIFVCKVTGDTDWAEPDVIAEINLRVAELGWTFEKAVPVKTFTVDVTEAQ